MVSRLYLLSCDWCPYEKRRNTGLKEEYSEGGSEDWNLDSIRQETPEKADTTKSKWQGRTQNSPGGIGIPDSNLQNCEAI